MSFSNFGHMFPGMERFLEETEVSVEINNGEQPAEDAAVETVSAVDDTETVVDTEGDAEATEATTEEMFRNFDELSNMLYVAKHYGVDRTFLALYNRRGELSSMLGMALPSCESFDAIGAPSTSVSRAVIAGLEGALGKVWEFIKRIAGKVVDFVKRIGSAIFNLFASYERQIKRLLEAEKNLTNKTPSESVKHVTVEALSTALTTVNEASKHIQGYSGNDAADLTSEKIQEAFKAPKESLEKIKLEATDATMDASTFKKAIGIAQSCLSQRGTIKTQLSNALRNAKDAYAEAKRNESMGTVYTAEGSENTAAGHDEKNTKAAKNRVSYLSASSSLCAKVVKSYTRVIKAALGTAAAYIRACKGKAPTPEKDEATKKDEAALNGGVNASGSSS